MTTSSVLTNYSITSTDTITISNSTSDSYYYTTGAGMGGSNSGTITISNGGSGSSSGFTIGGAGSGFSWSVPEEWDGCFPDWNRIQTMCDEYPALKIAFDKFKTTYKLVKDHYDTPEDQRPLP